MKTQAAPLNNQLTVQCPRVSSERQTASAALTPAANATTDLAQVLRGEGRGGWREASLRHFLKVPFPPSLKIELGVSAVTHAGDAAPSQRGGWVASFAVSVVKTRPALLANPTQA